MSKITRRSALGFVAVAVAEMLGRKAATAHGGCHCQRGCYYYVCTPTTVLGPPYQVCRFTNNGRDNRGNVRWGNRLCYAQSSTSGCDIIGSGPPQRRVCRR